MTLQGVSANLPVEEGTKHSKHVYTPRNQVSLWESPFKWTVEHLRGNPKDGIIKRLFDLAIGLVVALPIALTGIGALLLWREYVIEKEDEAFKSAQVQATAKRTKLIAKSKKILKSTKTKAQQEVDSTTARFNTERNTLSEQIAELEAQLSARPPQIDFENYLNQRADITPAQLAQLEARLQTFTNELNSRPDREALEQALRDAEARGAAGKVPQNDYNVALSQTESLSVQYRLLLTQKDQALLELERLSEVRNALQNELAAAQRELANRGNITPAELEQLNQQVVISQSNYDHLQTDYRAKIAELRQITEQATRDNNTFQAARERSQSEIQNLQNQITGLQTELQNRGNISVNDLNVLNEQLYTLNTQLETKHREVETLNGIIATTNDKKADLQERLEVAIRQITALQDRPDITAEAVAKLQNRVNLTEDEFNERIRLAREQEAADQQAAIANLTQNLQNMQAERNEKQAKIERLTQQVEQLNTEVNARMPLDLYDQLIQALATYHEQQGGNALAFNAMATETFDRLRPPA